jgi:hypothetical protein
MERSPWLHWCLSRHLRDILGGRPSGGMGWHRHVGGIWDTSEGHRICLGGCLPRMAIQGTEAVFGQLEGTFGLLKEGPRFYVALFMTTLAVSIVSLKWLPFWLAFGILLALDFILAFVEKLDELGEKYTPPNADALVEACLQRLEYPKEMKGLLETALRKLLRIVREYGPPERDLEAQAFAITDAISILALDIKDMKYRSAKRMLE